MTEVQPPPYRRVGDVAVVTIDNPPVNAVNAAVRRQLWAGLQGAFADPAVRAVVLRAAGRTWPAGADINELRDAGQAQAEPHIDRVHELIAAAPKPVVARLHGSALGGGLELALACQWRLAMPEAKIGFPEIHLGLLPGGGGTQRAARLAGVAMALELVVGGVPIDARRAHEAGLIDGLLADGDDADLAWIETMLRAGSKPRLPQHLSVPAEPAVVADFSAKLTDRQRAQPWTRRAIAAVAAAQELDFAAGLAEERRLFNEGMASPEFRALSHLFFAERECSRVPGIDSATPLLPLEAAAVIGGGTMGCGIAIALLEAGFPVTLVEQDAAAAGRAGDAVVTHYASLVARGRLDDASAAQRRGRLVATADWAALGSADLVIEAVFEEMALKEEVFRRLGRETRPGTILASNTSTLDINRIAAVVDDPGRVVGLHFFSPANVMRLLEVVRGAKTSASVLATSLALARRLGKIGVVAGVCDGFIGNRMIFPYLREAVFLLEEGADPAQVDAALEAFGMAMGPFAMSDLAGNDVGWRLRLAQRPWEDRSRRYSFVPDRLCEAGRFGQKTGAGWYDYSAGARRGNPSPVVSEIVAERRRELGIEPRPISDEEIVERCLLPLVNEGHRVLNEGIALRASDVDVVYAHGFGFPRHRGGPMFWAAAHGPDWLASRLLHYAALHGADWLPASS